MKIKVAVISYRTLFHSILILVFLLPFLFILTALVTLQGTTPVNDCSSSFDCLGRRPGPRLLGRADDSGKLVRDFHKILNQMNSEAVPNDLKLPQSFSQLVSEIKSKKYNAKEFALILKGMMEKAEKEKRESKFAELTNKHFAASAVPKGSLSVPSPD